MHANFLTPKHPFRSPFRLTPTAISLPTTVKHDAAVEAALAAAASSVVVDAAEGHGASIEATAAAIAAASAAAATDAGKFR